MIVFDTEYRNKYNLDDIVLISFFNTKTGEMLTIRNEDLIAVPAYIEQNKDEVFACFTANADLPVLLTCGVDVLQIRFVDIYLLYKQLTMSHPKYLTKKPSLVNALKAFDIDVGYGEDEKVDTVKLILGSTKYTPEEWDIIQAYCEKDTSGLGKLADACIQVIADKTGQSLEILWDVQEFHGQFLCNVAHADYYNKGFPVNVGRLDDIFDNLETIKFRLAEKVNEEYCYGELPIYKFKKTKKRTGIVEVKYTFNMEAFTAFLKRKGLYSQWEKTEKGQVSTKSDVFLDKVKSAPHLSLLYRTRKTFQDLNEKSDMREWCVDGYIKGKPTGFWMSKPYGTKTFRSSPLPAHGFILNKTPWIRCALVEPHEGMAIVSCDWSAQEVAIAASLSKDKHMRDLYNEKRKGGDIYLFMAKKAGSAPDNATVTTHDKIRSMFKIVQLGLGYGMGIDSLGHGIYNASLDDEGVAGISQAKARMKAELITAWHKRHFRIYWKWIEKHINTTRRRGYQFTADGLVNFIGKETNRTTAIQNYPIQARAATMMRMAFCRAVDAGLDIICSHHDAFYVSCKAEDAERVATELERCMLEASDVSIGNFCPVIAKAKIQYHGTWFNDPRGTKQLETLRPLLGWEENNNNNKIEENDNVTKTGNQEDI